MVTWWSIGGFSSDPRYGLLPRVAEDSGAREQHSVKGQDLCEWKGPQHIICYFVVYSRLTRLKNAFRVLSKKVIVISAKTINRSQSCQRCNKKVQPFVKKNVFFLLKKLQIWHFCRENWHSFEVFLYSVKGCQLLPPCYWPNQNDQSVYNLYLLFMIIPSLSIYIYNIFEYALKCNLCNLYSTFKISWDSHYTINVRCL